MTTQTFRTITVHGRRYRQRVEYSYDPQRQHTRTRVLESLGPVTPIYRRAGGLPTYTLPYEPTAFGTLALQIMNQELTPRQLLDQLEELLPEPPPPSRLEAVGIRYDLGGKTLQLLLWTRSPSDPSRRAGATPTKPSHR